ncbi:metallophosphoesterase family protein [Paenibacillus alba]|uniref:Metallophosphoesterase family protein n=1 Tax=Paenibacillus alba TaxID=1197127 RepID=A0ABU6G5V4_9BACL|nr:metallophosphoesterase family protein [Paenibacillus alba]MEC0229551.1 metallophosphoesterase family protein [Paenibacillus alba]
MSAQLTFREDRTFTIAQFTDIHWKDGGSEDQLSRKLMEQVLDAERPDFVVFTGDVIYTGYIKPGDSACEEPAKAFREAVQAVESRGIKWAVVFGNHDTESRITREQLMEVVCEHNHTVAQAGLEELHGVGNYSIQVKNSQGETGAVMYFFDSGNLSPYPHIGGYDWIQRDQIHWYTEESLRIMPQDRSASVPALAFFHIPLPEYKEVWESQTCYGNKFEPVCCAKVNAGMFAAMLEMGDVVGTFAGHDHVNDYWGNLHGIRLCYGRATGYNTYGQEGFARGARLIRLTEGQREFETWLRLADGSVIEQQPEHVHGS